MRHEPTVPDATTSPPFPSHWPHGQTRVILQISAATAALVGAPGLAMAYPTFTPPAGVSEYRLLFVTADSTTATSANISSYNTFVTTEAAQNTSLPGTIWKAIVSTPSVSAVTNVDCGTNCDANVPIYLVDGTTLVAASANAFFSTGAAASPGEDQFGAAHNPYVWTGSTGSGGGYAGYEMGATNGTELGDPSTTNTYMLASSYDLYNGVYYTPANTNPIYAISGDIIVPPVPEPASGSALLIGGLIVTRVFRRRRH